MQRNMFDLKTLTDLLFKQNSDLTSDNDLMPNENINIDDKNEKNDKNEHKKII